MINLIIPVVKDFEKWAELIKTYKFPQANIIVGVTERGKDFFKFKKTGLKLVCFQNGSLKEEIINSLQEYLQDGKTMVIRKMISQEEVLKFFNAKEDIAICAKKKRNKFSDFFYKLWAKIVKSLFDFTFFDGDVSVVAFSENLSSVIRNIPNLSYASRINRWKGVTIGAVETDSKPVKKEYSKVRNNFMLLGWILMFLGVITGTTVYFIFRPATFLAGFLWACGILIMCLVLIITIVIYIMNIKAGKRYFDKAKEV